MDHHAKSLETKWDDINRDFIKQVVATYDAINALDEYGTTYDKVIMRALKLYKQKVGTCLAFKDLQM